MIFAHKGYKNIVKGKNWDDWVKLINDDQEYCKKLRYTKPFKKIKPTSLPSWHPYWGYIVRQNDIRYLNELIHKYKLCLVDTKLIKVYFNASTTLEKIEHQIELLKNRL